MSNTSSTAPENETQILVALLDQLDIRLIAHIQRIKDRQTEIEEEMNIIRSQMEYINENFLKKKT